MVQPPTECFWSGTDKQRVRCRFGHFQWLSAHVDQWVWLPAWDFLLLFCGNRSPKIYHCCVSGMGQTDRWTDGSQHCYEAFTGAASEAFAVWLHYRYASLELHPAISRDTIISTMLQHYCIKISYWLHWMMNFHACGLYATCKLSLPYFARSLARERVGPCRRTADLPRRFRG